VRKRTARKSRSNMVLDVRKLYLGGLAGDLLKPIETPLPDENDFDIEFCNAILGSNAVHFEALVLLGDAYTRKGEFKKGLELDLRLTQMRPDNKNIQYNLACSYALTGQTERAVECLTKAVELGYRDVQHLREDHDLDAIKSDPRFLSMLERLSAEELQQK
jgi:tetratricopeptide (TPR) repeat protein